MQTHRTISILVLLGVLLFALGIGWSVEKASGLMALAIDGNLDSNASNWGVYTEVATPGAPTPTWEKNNVSSPALDGLALRCAITGGIKYSNVHCYRDLPADPSSNLFVFNLAFQYRPVSTFNNVGGSSIVQALEFTMNKWHQGQRYEWALQWENVGNGAPKWRYWAPNQNPKWVDLNIAGSFNYAGEAWHTLKMEGEILDGKVHYKSFTIDGQTYPLDILVSPAPAAGWPNKMAVAVQLDGNDFNNSGHLSPYDIILDQVTFTHDTGADLHVNIGGAQQGSYVLPVRTSQRKSYSSVNSGPVNVQSTNGIPINASERVAYSPDGGTTWTSYSELMGMPVNQLTTSYTFPWYNNANLNTQLRFGNVGSAATTVTVTVGGQIKGAYPLLPNQSTRASYPGLNAGPVKVTSSGNVPIIASERVAYFDGTDWTSFSEMMGLPSTRLTTSYMFPRYNNVDINSQLRFGNVGTSPTTVTVTVGGLVKGTYQLLPNQSTRVSYPGLDDGPVKVISSGGVPIIASMRVAYTPDNGVTWPEFSEIMGLPLSSLSTSYSFPVYNNVDLNTQLRFGNVGAATTTVTVTIGGVVKGNYIVTPNASQRVSYPVNGGPVVIQSSGNVPIIASMRVAYFDSNISKWTSFAEMMGLPKEQLTTSYLFPWYNNVELNTQLRFGVP